MAQEDDIVEQADRLMYVAKDAGKNALHIGRGEGLERVLRAAFPAPAPTSSPMEGMLAWVDTAERQDMRRRA